MYQILQKEFILKAIMSLTTAVFQNDRTTLNKDKSRGSETSPDITITRFIGYRNGP